MTPEPARSTVAEPVSGIRMKASERRELVLAAAAAVFGERGYQGATTDSVAKAAGVSQPYVVRMFGTKAALFQAVLERSLDRLAASFRDAIVESADEPDEMGACIGRYYVELLRDRGMLLSLMQAFMLGADPEIGPTARAGFLRIYRILRDEAQLSAQDASEFLSGGMMINTLVGLQMAATYDDDSDVREIIDATLPTKAVLLRDLAQRDVTRRATL